jgi:curved DNA-binding protein CbpA
VTLSGVGLRSVEVGMEQISGSLRDRSLFEVIERVRAGWRSGTLVVRSGDQTRRFTFVDGDLYLPAAHTLARQMAKLLAAEQQWLARPEAATHDPTTSREPQHRAPLRKLITRIAELLGQLREGDYSFQEGSPEDPGELVGPLWSPLLMVEGAAVGPPRDDLMSLLGGEDAIVVGRVGPDTAPRLGVLGPEIAALLMQLETPATLGELSRRAGGAPMLARLHGLRNAGLVTVLAPGPERDAEAAVRPLAPGLAERLSTRIAESLLRDPLSGDAADQRREVAGLLSRLGSLDHYELLGVTPLANDREVHEAFERLGRTVHPLNAERLRWIGHEGVLRLLFERATSAYAVLSDPVRRTEYNREAGIALGVEVTGERRQKEVEQLASQLYERASQLAEREDYFLAVELLRQAIAHQPRSDYYALLGRIQRRNPKWLREAQDSFRRAIQLAPDDAELRVELARLQERGGEAESAKASYRAVLERRPGDATATAALRRLERYAASSKVQGESGWLGRLLGWFRRRA